MAEGALKNQKNGRIEQSCFALLLRSHGVVTARSITYLIGRFLWRMPVTTPKAFVFSPRMEPGIFDSLGLTEPARDASHH